MREANKSKYDHGRWERNAILAGLALLSLPVHLCGDSLSFTGTLPTPEDIFTQTVAVGANQNAARTAGMSVPRSYVIVMVISGALMGLAGASQALGTTNTSLTGSVDAGIGFTAITVALLGQASPTGIVLAGLLFGALQAGSVKMLVNTGIPNDVATVMQSVIVLFIAAPALIRGIFRLRESRGGGVQQLAKGWNG